MTRVAAHRLQTNFSRAAEAYDARAVFQHVQTRRVLDAALMLLPERATLVDIGCGTGFFAACAAAKRPQWRIYGLDIAAGMCRVAQPRCQPIQGNACTLPFANASVDAAVSTLCYQWVEEPRAAYAELARVLKAGGTAIVASLGEQSLQELRGLAQDVSAPLRLLTLRSHAETLADMRAAGFNVLLADARTQTEHYPSVRALLDSMRSIGAGHNFMPTTSAVSRLSPTRWAALLAAYEELRTSAGIPATWEHHFFVLHKPL